MDKKCLGEVVKAFICLLEEFHEFKDNVAAMRDEAAQLCDKEDRRVEDKKFFDVTIEEGFRLLKNSDKSVSFRNKYGGVNDMNGKGVCMDDSPVIECDKEEHLIYEECESKLCNLNVKEWPAVTIARNFLDSVETKKEKSVENIIESKMASDTNSSHVGIDTDVDWDFVFEKESVVKVDKLNFEVESGVVNERTNVNAGLNENSAKLDATFTVIRGLENSIRNNGVHPDEVVLLHFDNKRMLYSELGGCPFDMELFDLGKDECGRLVEEVRSIENVVPKPILNRSSLNDFCSLNEHEAAPMEYVMNPNLPPDEVLFLGEKVVGRRVDFQTLGKNKLVSPRVVNCLVEILTTVERFERGNQNKFWWILTNLSRPDPASIFTLSEPTKWMEWCGALRRCEKVYVPVMAKIHWFLSVLIMKYKKVDVYDDFKKCSFQLGTAIMSHMLLSMDNVFKDKIINIFGSSWNFFGFNVAEAPDHNRRYVGNYDSSLEVMKTLLREHVDGVFSEQVPQAIQRLYIGPLILGSQVNKVRDITINKVVG
ncbi:uncharacterized protein LOC133791584 [Humulus lupulus]|uniref:uncharacterized protein LOC133791584 n=1 Tax=Humulus lupulus TaxID=3486 RepID=UPI002B41811B|nr:uncharacterized protein LOC133791584 [Humulus lupulus]